MANPTLLDMPIARDGNKNAIPTTDNGTTGLLSQQYGWQLINAIPPQQGGKAVKREDFNGALYLLSNLLFYLQKGWQFEWDANQNYYAGCIVKDPNNGKMYQRLNDGTSNTAPHSDTTNWKLWDLSAYLPLSGGTFTGKPVRLIHKDTDSFIGIYGSDFNGDTSSILVYGRDVTGSNKGAIGLECVANGNLTSLLLRDGALSYNGNDLGGSAIVASSYDRTGYIKYACGLIIQYGESSSDNASVKIDLPISFHRYCQVIVSVQSSRYSDPENIVVRAYSPNNSYFMAYVSHDGSPANIGFSWLAIGY